MNTIHIHNEDFKLLKIDLDRKKNIIEKIDIVLGEYDCSNLKLTSLKNCPDEVFGKFMCGGNELTNLNFISKFHNSILAYNNNITCLKGLPEVINGSLEFDNNKLTNLDYCPKIVKGDFFCNRNEITSLKNGPEQITSGSRYWCNDNKLTTLNYVPKHSIDIHAFKNEYDLSIEISFVLKGYENYYLDLLKHCIDNGHSLDEIKTWPEGFLTENKIKSTIGISKFDL